MTKQEAMNKIAVAEKACAKVQTAWNAATDALAGGVAINGYGIYRDPYELRSKLEAAQHQINTALGALNDVAWPADAEYDLL
jgi:hypothetical protein